MTEKQYVNQGITQTLAKWKMSVFDTEYIYIVLGEMMKALLMVALIKNRRPVVRELITKCAVARPAFGQLRFRRTLVMQSFR